MSVRELVLNNRTCRRFQQQEAISRDTLVELVDLGRCSASAANAQPLRYYLACDPEENARIFPNLGWAAALKDWDGPEQGERPAAYIVIVCSREAKGLPDVDMGIASQSILLGAVEKGLAGCLLGNVKRDKLQRELGLDESLKILLVVALGSPAEERVIEPMPENGSVDYWRDEQGVHHVPKRGLDEIIITGSK
ncbi:MAG: nitroreductase [Desulfovibrio sp.]|nr:MAG: nitroreductase [Desulfovibrio sp.]